MRVLSVNVFEGSRSALRSDAFASAIDSSTNTPHAEWKSMLSGDCGPYQPLTHLQAEHISTSSKAATLFKLNKTASLVKWCISAVPTKRSAEI